VRVSACASCALTTERCFEPSWAAANRHARGPWTDLCPGTELADGDRSTDPVILFVFIRSAADFHRRGARKKSWIFVEPPRDGGNISASRHHRQGACSG
jgi:hypothetical protein